MIQNIRKQGKKWIAESSTIGKLQSPVPLSSKKLAQKWLDDKVIDAKFGNSDVRLFSAAIVKGLVEHDDGTRYFGSNLSYKYHLNNAIKLGYVTEENKVTAWALEWYERCLKQLPPTRQVFWTDGVGLPSERATITDDPTSN